MLSLSLTSAFSTDELIILSPHWEGIRYEFEEGFKHSYRHSTGREVELTWLDLGGASDILRYIRSEFRNRREGIRVDLFFGGGTDPYLELKSQELLQTYRVPENILSGVASELGGVPLYDEKFTWYAATMAGFGIIYNKIVIAKLGLPSPTAWDDLGRAHLFGWVGSGDPRKSGSIHMAYEIILQAYGWDRGWRLITAIGANARGFSTYGGQTPIDVTLGEVAYGMAIDSYAWAQVKEAGEHVIGFTMPPNLTIVSGDGLAILKGAPNPEVAKAFVRFVLTEEGQRLWVLKKGEQGGPQRFELAKFSVRPDLYEKIATRSAVRMNPFAWESDLVYDATLGSTRWNVINDLLGSQIVEPHGALRAAWGKARESEGAGEVLDRLSVMPLGEAEATRLAESGQWSNPVFRSRQLKLWSTFATDKYRAAGGGAGYVKNLPLVGSVLFFLSMVAYMKWKK